ncbi:UNVERIFIED_CONTAM: crotonobetainyl-CoA:carnitine CoA-transferase CaiB-like acyl-CoA transferase [Williamsia faeni]
MPTANAGHPLDGYVVVDLSTGIAGAYCTKLLADGGARIIKVEPPEGDPLRRWSASGAHIAADTDGALFSYLASSKHSVTVDPDNPDDLQLLEKLLTDADAVVWSRDSRITERPSLTADEIHRRYPHLTVTAITPFGLTGPWSDRPATEFTLQAWSGGIVGLGRGSPDRAPVHVGGQVGEWLTGAYASAGTLTSKIGTSGSGIGDLIDVSMLETEILCLTYYSVSFFDALKRPFRTTRAASVPGVAAAADGLVALGCGTMQQWFDLCVMVGHPEWIDEESTLSITERANQHAPDIYAWLSEQDVAGIRDFAGALRIPNAPVIHGANATEQDHFCERGSFTKNPRDGFDQPASPFRMQPAVLRPPESSPRLGEHTDHYRTGPARIRPRVEKPTTGGKLPFAGLRVLDMTAYWAGPSCTHFLAMLGAEVIHLESTRRPDGTRLIAGVPVTEDLWWERSPIFSGLNTNKKSLTLDFQTDRGQQLLRQLVGTADIIVENYTPRVLDQIGIDFAGVHALRPDAIMVRMPGFGLDGPWRENPAFAYVIEDASGLTWLTGYPDQNPLEPYSLGDPNAGVHALNALLLALEHRTRTGEGVAVEVAMVDAALGIAAEQVTEYSAYGNTLQRDGNRGPTAAPQNLYLSADVDEFGRNDCWIAVAVATDSQWAGLHKALGGPEWALDPALDDAAGRRLHHDLIDTELAAFFLTMTSDSAVELLCDAGVPAAKVMQPHRTTEIPQLTSRRFYEQVDHPVNGPAAHSTTPIRFTDTIDHFHRAPAPLLGEHNQQILRELGLTDDEIDALQADGIIGTSPDR